MFRSNASNLSASDRWTAGLLAAGVTFIVGYTLARVCLMPTSNTAASGDVQQNVIPHEGALWQDFGPSVDN